MNNFLFTYYLIFTSQIFGYTISKTIPVNFGDNKSVPFNSGELVEFEIDNQSLPKDAQLIIQIEDTSLTSCYQLLLSEKQIPLMSFKQDVLINQEEHQQYQNDFQIKFVDIDGLASGSKTLSAWFQNPSSKPLSSKLYAYLIGPYQFGASSVNSIPSLSYVVNYQLLNSFTCLNNCSSNGQCSPDGFCVCNEGYISRDCSIEAIFWNLSKKTEGIFKLNQGDKRYFAVDFTNSFNKIGSDIIFEFKTTGETVTGLYTFAQTGRVDLLVPDYELWLFNSQQKIDKSFQASNQGVLIKLRKEQILQFVFSDVTLVILFTTKSTSTQVTYLIGAQSSNDGSIGIGLIILFVILGILAFLALIYTFIVCTRNRFKKSLTNRLRNQIQQQQQQEQQLQVNEVQNNSNQNIERRKAQQNPLTLSQINQYMPAQLLEKQLKDVFSAESCAVCLEDFAICKEKVRLTICQHLFHSDCLISWMEKQQNCPFCRHELTLEQLSGLNLIPPQQKAPISLELKSPLTQSKNVKDLI